MNLRGSDPGKENGKTRGIEPQEPSSRVIPPLVERGSHQAGAETSPVHSFPNLWSWQHQSGYGIALGQGAEPSHTPDPRLPEQLLCKQ